MQVNLTQANLTSWLFWGPGTVHTISGMNTQNANLYIQLHEVPPVAGGITLGAGAVPGFKSLQVAANSPFYFTLDVSLKECLYAVSTTEANYTAVGANGGLDCTIIATSIYQTLGTEVVVGDLTTNLATKQIWAEASGPNRLLRLDVINQSGAAAAFVIQSTDTLSTASSLLGQAYALANNTNVNAFNFGPSGYLPYTQDASASPPTSGVHQGCSVYVTTSAAPPYSQSGVNANIRGIYRPA